MRRPGWFIAASMVLALVATFCGAPRKRRILCSIPGKEVSKAGRRRTPRLSTRPGSVTRMGPVDANG